MTDDAISDAIHALLRARSLSASICPSEVARALETDVQGWRALMPEVRRVAALMAARGLLRVTRGRAEVDALAPGGPVRFRLPGG